MRAAPRPAGRPDTDEDLFDRAREGDRSAFEALYLRHRPAACRLARRVCTCHADADDAVAEAFTRVLSALPRLAGRQINFRAYLFATVRNVATDRYRRMAKTDLREMLPESPAESEADGAVFLALDHLLVRQALHTLPDRWRTVLWLTTVEGLGPVEVGRRLGLKPSAAAAVAYRSRQGLRSAFAEVSGAVA